MKKYLIIIAILFVIDLFSYEIVNYNESNGKLQSDIIYDVCFYDTNEDEPAIEGWRDNTSASWYQEANIPNDCFTGYDLDTNRWDEIPSLDQLIYSNEVQFNCRTNSNTHRGSGLSSASKWQIPGNIEMEISFSDYLCDNNGELRLSLVNSEDPFQIFSTSLRMKPDGEKVFTSVYTYGVHPGINEYGTEVVTTVDEGKLMVTRQGNLFSSYYGYWDSEYGWSFSLIDSRVLDWETTYSMIYHYGGYQNDLQATIDDFIINGITTFGNHPSLNRGTRQSFPEQAILVAHEKGIDIFDAGNDALWMRFTGFYGTAYDPVEKQNMVADKVQTITALNGRIYCGAKDGAMLGVSVIDFVQDKSWFYDTANGWDCLANIGERNMHRGWTNEQNTYTSLHHQTNYDIDVKKIEGKTFLAVANGLIDTKPSISVINIEDNSTRFCELTSTETPVIQVEIASNNQLYCITLNRIARNETSYRMSGDGTFSMDASSAIAIPSNEDASSLTTTENDVILGKKDLFSPYANGGSNRRNLTTFGVQSVYSTSSILWGSGNTYALESYNNTLWLGTNHQSDGRVYAIGLEEPKLDQIRGEFNSPDIFTDIVSLSFGMASTQENLLVGYTQHGISRISGIAGEITMENQESGCEIQHQFISGSSFTYNFTDAEITVNPADSKANYGNVNVIYHTDEILDMPNPDHALNAWFEITSETGFDAFPCDVNFSFEDPVPLGESNLILFHSEDGSEWITASESSGVYNIVWNYGVSPYSVSFRTDHFSSWATSNGDGDNPLPVILGSFSASFCAGIAQLNWNTYSEQNNCGWNIYRGNFQSDFQQDQAIKVNSNLISGSGSTIETTDYTFFDPNPIENHSTYWYWLESIDFANIATLYGPYQFICNFENDNPDSPNIPLCYGLHDNYPNPFNPNTTISFVAKEASHHDLAIYNSKGQLIKTMFSGFVEKDSSISCVWDGLDDNMKSVRTGVYLYQLKSGENVMTKRMVMLK